MADNVAITQGSGTNIATDDCAGVHVQIVRLAHGPDGTLDFDGLDVFKSLDVDETEDEIKATPGVLYGYQLYNGAASARFVKFYNATAATVVVGTTVPVLTIAMTATSTINLVIPHGLKFGTAICVAATTGVADNDTGAPGANEVVGNFFYA